MKVGQFLQHHGISRNPFAEEDAQTDPVFKEFCIESTYHPAWDKVYGDPRDPATSIVFGEKGSGKTAMRLQIQDHLQKHNREHRDQRIFVIAYDDFNPFLDRFRNRLSKRKRRADRALQQWRLWDHMDAILSLGVTNLVDGILETRAAQQTQNDIDPSAISKLDDYQCRDLLLLAACYDQSTAETFKGRWQRLRKKLKFHPYRVPWDFGLAAAWSLLMVGLLIWLTVQFPESWQTARGIGVLLVAAAVGWLPYAWRWGRRCRQAWRVTRSIRSGNQVVPSLRYALLQFSTAELSGQPCPSKESTDDRYELLLKFQGILQTLGFRGVMVLLDRVDEPHMINGSAELMKQLIWPLLDNKFLKHPGLGLKLMLPLELTRFVENEERDFFQRSRLDKQNVVSSFEWTGEALFDVTNARIEACAAHGETPTLSHLFDDSVSEHRLIEAFRSLRTPRRLFKFLYQLVVEHCNNHTNQDPVWEIDSRTLDATLAAYLRHQEAYDRGLGTM
jgi:hypothetical protein